MNSPHIPQEALLEATAAQQVLAKARSYPVPTTSAEYEQAANELMAIKARAKTVEEWFERLKKPIREAAKGIDAFFKTPRENLEQAEAAIKEAMKTYNKRQEAIRLEAERLAAEAAAKEKARLEAEAARVEEAARIKREAEELKAREKRAKEEAAAQAARDAENERARLIEEQGRAADAERIRQEAEIAEAERRANAQEAENRRVEAAAEAERVRLARVESARAAAAAMPSAPVVTSGKTKVSGISSREVWSAELFDLDKLIAAAAGGNDLARSLLEFKQSTGNKLASTLKGGLNVPGIRAVMEANIAAKARS